jgi:hypothetical protein
MELLGWELLENFLKNKVAFWMPWSWRLIGRWFIIFCFWLKKKIDEGWIIRRYLNLIGFFMMLLDFIKKSFFFEIAA